MVTINYQFQFLDLTVVVKPESATQVKWNFRNPHILASSHNNQVLVWDERVKTASPLLIPRLRVPHRKDPNPSTRLMRTTRKYTESTGLDSPTTKSQLAP
jgi:hypothetical protein